MFQKLLLNSCLDGGHPFCCLSDPSVTSKFTGEMPGRNGYSKTISKTSKVFLNLVLKCTCILHSNLTILFLNNFLRYKHNFMKMSKRFIFFKIKYFWMCFSALLSSKLIIFVFYSVWVFFNIELDFFILDDGLLLDLKICLNSFYIFQKKPVFIKFSLYSVWIYFYFLHHSNYL